MKRHSIRAEIFLVLDGFLLLACLFHMKSLQDANSPPFGLVQRQDRVYVGEVSDPSAGADLQEGDKLLLWQDLPVRSPEMVKFLSSLSSRGAQVPVTYQRDDSVASATVTLVPAHDSLYLLIIYFVGIVTWAVGVFVLLKRRDDVTAGILHWALVGLGVSVMMTRGAISADDLWSYLSRVLFFVSYLGGVATFFLFTAMFPRPKPGSLKLKSWLTYAPVGVILAGVMYNHLRAIHYTSIDAFMAFDRWYDILGISLFLYVGGGLFNLFHSAFTAGSSEERRKLKWILWGLVIGPAPFLLLNTLPILLTSREIVPEEFTIAFLMVIPFAFAISFIKYRLLDIEVVINRTTVYAIVLGIVTALYYALVVLVTSIIGAYAEKFSLTISVGAAILVAFLFEPARRWVQRFVDRTFFRVRYNYREAQRRFVEEIKRCLDVTQLIELIVRRTDELIPVERIGFFSLLEPSHRLRLVAHKNFDELERHSVRFELEKLKSTLQLPVALHDNVEQGVTCESADAPTFRRWGMVIVFPMLSEHSEVLGFLVLGRKKSGARFSSEDIDLLNSVMTQAGLTIERLTLQVKLMLEHAETQRLEELNRLKSDFVSFASHELRTPLTSIKMFAELLRSRRGELKRKSLGYLRVIEGETDRLNRMVTNILDSATIEKGMKQYVFKTIDVRRVIRDVMRTMKYQLDNGRFRVRVTTPKRPVLISADPDAVSQVFINLIANSLKYSTKNKYLKISVSTNSEWLVCHVKDRGSGISRQALPHLFDKFYRDPTHSLQVQGVGLGLPLVKHIMDVHGGKIEVKSTLGKGSTFSLWFPLVRHGGPSKE